MSILINLLPDLRLTKQREKHRRQLATGIAIAIWGICAAIIVVLTLVVGSQGLLIKGATSDIKTKTSQLESTPNIIDALTVQEHLDSLDKLNGERSYMTKFLQAYSQSDPTAITINSLSFDSTRLITIDGTGTSYAVIAKLQRAMEQSNLSIGTGADIGNTPYFTDIQLSSLSKSNNLVAFTLKATAAEEVTNGK